MYLGLKQFKSQSNGTTIVFNLSICTFIITMMWLGNCPITIELILFCYLACASLTKAGELALQACHLLTINAWLPMAFVVGFALVSISMMALVFGINISALSAFLITGLFVLALCLSNSGKSPSEHSPDWADAINTLFFAIIIGCLAKTPVSSPSALKTMGALPMWSDYFLHGITISAFGSPFAMGGDMQLVGVKLDFYHYASFIFSAAFQSVSDMSGLALSTSLLLPLGLFIAALGSYAFAVEIGGRLAGLLAITAIIALPIPSQYIESGWFDFYWLLFISPGTGYGIGVSMAVCTLTVAFMRDNDNKTLWFTLLLLSTLILLQAFMFLLLAPAILTMIFLKRCPVSSRLLIKLAISAVIMIFLAVYFSENIHGLWIKYIDPQRYLNFATQWSPMYVQHIKPLLGYAPNLTIFVQIVFVLVATLGVYIVLYPLIFRIIMNRCGFNGIDLLPLILIIFFIGLLVFVPNSSIGGQSYKYRHFPLLYVITVVYTITTAFNLAINNKTNEKKLNIWIYGIVISIFGMTILFSWESNPARPNMEAMPWTKNFYNHPATPGLLETSQYLKAHAKQGDVIAMNVSSTVGNLRSPITEVISITGIPAYIARSDLQMMRSGCVQKIADTRLKVLKELLILDNWHNAQHFLQNNGVRWFLVLPGEKLQWDSARKFASFSSNGLTVYDAGHSANENFKNSQC